MNILVTGGGGFLGKYIVSEISSSNNVCDISRSSKSKVDLSKKIPYLEFKADAVIHVAGLAHSSPKNYKESELFHKINVIGTQNLLKGLEISGFPKSLVFISTVAVYGEIMGISINESAELKAKDPYGKSKIQAEKLISNWCKENNVVCTILRLPLVVGTNPPGNLGDMINGIKKGYYFNIAGGKAKKSMVLAEDVAKFILKASEVGGVYNLTDGYHPDFNQLSNSIAEQLGKNKPFNLPLPLSLLAAKFGDFIGSKAPINSDKLQKITSNLTFDDSKARAAFGWNPTPVLDRFKIN
jgi:nucleoside-diphosphate-sugar epimerase